MLIYKSLNISVRTVMRDPEMLTLLRMGLFSAAHG